MRPGHGIGPSIGIGLRSGNGISNPPSFNGDTIYGFEVMIYGLSFTIYGQ